MRFNRRSSQVPNYFGRQQQRKLLGLVMLLGLVVLGMQQAANPRIWAWLFGDLEPVDQYAVLDNRAAITRPPEDPTGVVVMKPDRGEPSEAELLDTLKDGGRLFPEEQPAFNLLLKKARDALDEPIAGEPPYVTFVQLFNQPKVYRGKVVTVEGTIKRIRKVDPARDLFELFDLNGDGRVEFDEVDRRGQVDTDEDLLEAQAPAAARRRSGFELRFEPYDADADRALTFDEFRAGYWRPAEDLDGYYEVVLQLHDRPDIPIIIFALRLPDNLAESEDLHEAAAISGIFVKLCTYMAASEAYTTPLLIAPTFTTEPRESPLRSAEPPFPWWVAVVAAAAISAVFALVVYLGSRAAAERLSFVRRAAEGPDAVTPLQDVELAPDVGESLRQLAQQDEQLPDSGPAASEGSPNPEQRQ